MEKISEKLLDKSKEAFIMAIELYNKPTVRYRVEGFAMFICNAWELMLKSHLINEKGIESIYYKDNPERTISLENCIKEIFTNKNDPQRINLEKIVELRNTSTHFITEEYEMLYVPLFQACIFNFNEKIEKFHGFDMSSLIPKNFLTLAVSISALNESEIIAKYPESIANKLLSLSNSINELSVTNNSSFAIRIDHRIFITKNKDNADSVVGIDNDSDDKVRIVREVKDPSNTHGYNAKKCIETINAIIKREAIPYRVNGTDRKFNQYDFGLFLQYYGLKTNPSICYIYKVSLSPQYSYSYKCIEFIIGEIKKDPENIFLNLKSKITKNKLTPGAKEF